MPFRIFATHSDPSLTKGICIAPNALQNVRLDVPLAGAPQLLQGGPIKFTASGHSDNRIHRTNLNISFKEPLAQNTNECDTSYALH